MLFTVQLLLALIAFLLIAIGLTMVGSFLRLGVDLCLRRSRPSHLRGLDWEGVIVGAVVVGVWLGRPTRDVYLNPYGPERLEVTYPSRLELPFGYHLYSDLFTLVTATYIDAEGHSYQQSGREGIPENTTMRVAGRTIHWSSARPTRVIVRLPESGTYFFFPEPIYEGYAAPEGAVKAYLRGDPIASVKAMID